MKRFRLTKLAALLTIMSCSQFSHAAAFQFYELGTPIIATAGVGQAALSNDASTSYFNPAGMTALSTSQLMLGGQFILPYTNFTPNNSNTINGNNGGTASSLVPGLAAYYVYRATPKLGLGVSLTSPYGGALAYNNHWVGRYVVQQTTFYTIDLNPALAYQANDWLSFGGGVVLEYANLNQTVALPLTAIIDGQANVKVDNFAYGLNLGVLFTPDAATKIGLAYRSQIVHHLSGNSNFLNISVTPSTNTKMVMPANLIGSIARSVNDKFTVLGELGWANWSSMRDTVVSIEGYSAVTPMNWHNTYRVGLGGRYQLLESLLVQSGISYDSSPTSSANRLPDLPMDRQIRVGAGIEYALIKAATFGFSYEYMNMGNAPINNSSSLGVLSGAYSRNYANVIQVSINVSC